jgi:cytochrome c553
MRSFKLLWALIISSTFLMADGGVIYKKCAKCHGVNGNKKALGKSAVIAGRSASKTVAQLSKYKAGKLSINGMGNIMKSQLSTISKKDMEAVAKYIAGLK